MIDKLRAFLSRRQSFYRAVFDITSPASRAVLEDLAQFCRANATTFLPDPRAHAVLEGRREVWLRIQQHLQLSEAQLWELSGAGKE